MKNYLNYINQIFFLSGNNNKKLITLFFIILSVSIFDLLGIGLIGPYFSIIINPESTKELKLLSFINLSNTSYSDLILFFGLILIGIFFIRSVVGLLINKYILNFSWSKQVEIQSYLLKEYQSLEYDKYLNRNSSEYIQSIQHLVPAYTEGVLLPLLRVMSDGIVSIVIIILLAYLSFKTFLFLFLIILILFFGYSIIFGQKSKKFGVQANIATNKLIQSLNESILGLKDIRILSIEKYFHEKMESSAKDFSNNKVNSLIISTIPRFLLEFILIFFVITMIIISIFSGNNIESSLSVLVVFGTASLRLIPSASNILGGITLIRFGRNATQRLYNDLNKINQKKSTNNLFIKGDKLPFKDLTLNDISYSYPNTNSTSIKNISLKINAGEMIGIIGKSGTGKTTLINLILGLLIPQRGKIQYNNSELKNNTRNYWSKIAHIPQDIFLIDATLKNNIALGLKDEEINYNKLKNAVKKAKLSDFVQELPDKFETMIGERGMKLSGGQKQRIALARAFYFEKEFIILDEVTSSLDSETENQIISEINQLKGEKTVLIITHKHSTIKKCDRIIMLDKGEIIKEGGFEEIY